MCSTVLRLFAFTALLSVAPTALAAQAVLNPFEGSEVRGIYEADFDVLVFATAQSPERTQELVEGKIVSRILVKPANKTNVELYRSYRSELEAAGFTVHVAADPRTGNTQGMVWALYHKPNNDLYPRPYESVADRMQGGDVGRAGAGQYLLSASRTQDDATLYVQLVFADANNIYLIDEVTTAAMETGTVTLNLDLMRSAMEATGKIAVYDIHFATGSAVIEPESAEALAVIASYLGESSGSYYIVGHTDDVGTLEGNLTLSEERAAAVSAALVEDHGVDPSRLETRGVGPLSPVSTNTDDAGRALNRRVEIVQRLANE